MSLNNCILLLTLRPEILKEWQRRKKTQPLIKMDC